MSLDFAKCTTEVVEILEKVRVVPVLVLKSESNALKLCELLMKHNLKAAEITFRTVEAADIIKSISSHFPEIFVGAGTILNVADLRHAFDCGAKFAVAPGFNPRVVKAAIEGGMPFAPGVCTPTNIEEACELGCRFLKFFPAEAAGGVKMLSAMSAPYKHIGVKFMPTGGITSENAKSYLDLDVVSCVGGTWLGKSADVETGNWEKIDKLIEAATQL